MLQHAVECMILELATPWKDIQMQLEQKEKYL